jgi:hypothetical protein
MVLKQKKFKQILSLASRDVKSSYVVKHMFDALHDIVILLKIWDVSTEEQKLVLEKFLVLSGVRLLEGLSNTLQFLVKREDVKIILKTIKKELEKEGLKAPEWIKHLSALLFLRKKRYINFDETICQSILAIYNKRNSLTHLEPTTYDVSINNQNTDLIQPAITAVFRDVFAFLDIFLIEWCGADGDHLASWLSSEIQYDFGHYSEIKLLQPASIFHDKEYLEAKLNIKILFLEKILKSYLMSRCVELNSDITSNEV